jgi:hypothetical protein
MLTILVLSYTKFWLNIYPKSKIMMNFDRTFFTMATTSIGKREAETEPSPSANPPKKYLLASDRNSEEFKLILSTSLSCRLPLLNRLLQVEKYNTSVENILYYNYSITSKLFKDHVLVT